MTLEPIPILIGGLIALASQMAAFYFARKKRLIDDTPTSKVHGVFIGLVELKGTVECETPLISHLAGGVCVHYAWQVEEHWSRTVVETYRDAKGHTHTRTRHESGWKAVASGGDSTSFYLKDDTGVIRVLPTGASIEACQVFSRECRQGDPLYYGKGPLGAVAHSDHRRRFTEHAVPLHAQLYILGTARERQDVVAAEIAAAPDASQYLISVRSEEKISSGLGWAKWLWFLFGLAAAAGGVAVATGNVQMQTPALYGLLLAAGAVYLAVAVLAWLWMAFNSLVSLRQRVRHAWSLIDVQLKRRHDLIPNLVAAVEGLKVHERETQEALARLRSQLQATPPGQAGADFSGCTPAWRAVVEKYPELKANEVFLKLGATLIDTEQRIALARGYFNDITTFYNTRLEIIPDRFLARLGGFQPQTLFAAENFERAAVKVDLAS